MTETLSLAQETLLSPAGITEHHLKQVMEELATSSVDAADLFFQYSRLESWVLDDGIVKEGNFNLEQGAPSPTKRRSRCSSASTPRPGLPIRG